MVGVITAWLGGFILFYGSNAFKASLFPLLFLFLSVPPPMALVEWLMAFLQALSIELTHFMFETIGIPVFREGAYFSLPYFAMEIAEQCSGIRSALTFFVLSVLLAGFVLKKYWSRVLLNMLVIPIVVLENTLRILGMYLLAVHVHEDFLLPGPLHNLSGTFAFGGALFLLFLPTVVLLRWAENGIRDRRSKT
jgi:exosortase